jgi:hypothetical protein
VFAFPRSAQVWSIGVLPCSPSDRSGSVCWRSARVGDRCDRLGVLWCSMSLDVAPIWTPIGEARRSCDPQLLPECRSRSPVAQALVLATSAELTIEVDRTLLACRSVSRVLLGRDMKRAPDLLARSRALGGEVLEGDRLIEVGGLSRDLSDLG